ncbi:MAG: IS630 family transposase [Proteobacteria bacterium]|nr:IS630 family transposase [Pseudomonadota bacterium]
MARKAAQIACSEEQRLELERLVSNNPGNLRYVERAKVILLCLKGLKNKDIAEQLNIRPNTVTEIRRRFISKGIKGLYDQPRSGKPKKYGSDFRRKVLQLLSNDPPNGHSSWDGALIAAKLNASNQAVWRLLRKEGIQLSRRRNWNINTEPHFIEKTVDIVGFFLSPNLNAFVITVSEQIQKSSSRLKTGNVIIKHGKIGRVFETNLQQDSSIELLDAILIASENVGDLSNKENVQPGFLGFIEDIVTECSSQEEVHVIADASSIQENSERLQKHSNTFFHLTRSRSSWLAHIELWLSVFSSKKKRGIDFNKIAELREAIEAYIKKPTHSHRPFIWKKERTE